MMPIAAERDVHIIAEERAKRNVPSAPKLGCTFGNIGVIKVFKKAEAEEPAKADCHVRITRKIKINLKRISQNAQPC